MYNQYIVLYPSANNEPALRKLLDERVRPANAAGVPHALTRRMFSADQALTVVIRHEDLSEVEKYQERNEADPAYLKFRDEVQAVLGYAGANTMYREIVAANTTGSMPYLWRMFFQPELGKGPDLLKLLEARAADNNSRGVPCGLFERVVAGGSPTYMLTFLFPNMDAYQNRIENQPSDAGYAAFNAKLNEFIATPPDQYLSRVAVPFPSAA